MVLGPWKDAIPGNVQYIFDFSESVRRDFTEGGVRER